MANETRKSQQDGVNQAFAQYETIKELVEALEDARGEEDGLDDHSYEDAQQAIYEHPLEVTIRSGWVVPGSLSRPHKDRHGFEAVEYQILLCTGGPACRLIGTLNNHGEPETSRIQWQDWGTPWCDIFHKDGSEDVLLTYARCFYFGE